jgi:hypothetical protein
MRRTASIFVLCALLLQLIALQNFTAYAFSGRITAQTTFNAKALRLPPGAFIPALIVAGADRLQDNSQADNAIFRANHSQSYESLGRSTGYFEFARWRPSPTQSIPFNYQGSDFPSASLARAAQQDAVNFTSSSYRVTSSGPCSTSIGVTCMTMTFRSRNGRFSERFRVLSVGACVVEMLTEFNRAVGNQYGATIANTLESMTRAATSEMEAVCLLPSFSLSSVRVEKSGAKADWSFGTPSTKQINVGTKVRLSIYWMLHSYSARSHVSASIKVTQSGGGTVLKYSHSYVPPIAHGKQYIHTSWTPKTAGTYKVKGTVDIGGHSLSRHATLTVLSSAPPSFTFVRFQTYSSSGKPASTFKAGSTVVGLASYTVANVSGTTSIMVVRRYQYPSGGKWKALGHQVSETFQTVTGAQSYRFTFVAPTGYKQIRVILSLTIAKKTQTKMVTINTS